ncbi:MAG: tRNA (adenosine(37)-N6)-threonylcarbamoyltransferase complex ATPase subunit type 1 TsaE [Cellvibrionaceae bacterium]|nr:tRNA (adenosine(37)-N6)-threonylcarbamoyltransferase complex ATPase subunit type 1 TsaE [Cellvibrionaceae bacterium]|tara:strand:- start:17053 stop:17553 length:501 start_codon:yes stop_codon:yes gene_type:complete
MQVTEVTHYLDNDDATVAAGECVGRSLDDPATESGGAVIFLEGDLGAGKTTFSRGVMRAFGHSGAVKSPTYTLVEPYEFNGRMVYHFDLYRLGEPEELEYMGIRDYFSDSSVCLVEWPIRGEGVLPVADLVVTLAVTAPGRTLKVQAQTTRGQQILAIADKALSEI